MRGGSYFRTNVKVFKNPKSDMKWSRIDQLLNLCHANLKYDAKLVKSRDEYYRVARKSVTPLAKLLLAIGTVLHLAHITIHL